MLTGCNEHLAGGVDAQPGDQGKGALRDLAKDLFSRSESFGAHVLWRGSKARELAAEIPNFQRIAVSSETRVVRKHS